MFRTLALALALLTGLASVSKAEPVWVVDPTGSDAIFEYLKDGTPTEGMFSDFEGSGTFDPKSPEQARFQLQILSSSIDLYDMLASAFATSAEWFDSKNHPYISYTLERLTVDEGSVYAAEGTITIRGKSQPLKSAITLDVAETTAKASGTLTIRRTDFLLGVGPSAAFVDIGPEVQVRFNLLARRAD